MSNEIKPSEYDYYEKSLYGNPIKRYLHSHRYRHLVTAVGHVVQEIPDRPIKLLDIGCAQGKVYEILDPVFNIEYFGVDYDREFIVTALKKHGDNKNFGAVFGSVTEQRFFDELEEFDVVVALETLEHITDMQVVQIVMKIALMGPKLFICSVPNESGPIVWIKNFGSLLMGHKRTPYTMAENFWAGLSRFDHLPPHDYGHKGFWWKYLAHTIRCNMKILKITRMPIAFLPLFLSTNIFIVASPLLFQGFKEEPKALQDWKKLNHQVGTE